MEVNLTTCHMRTQWRTLAHWLAEREDAVFFRESRSSTSCTSTASGGAPRYGGLESRRKEDDRKDPGILSPTTPATLRMERCANSPQAAPDRHTDNDLANPQWRASSMAVFWKANGFELVVGNVGGWGKMMERYRAVLKNTRPPKIVGFNVQGSPMDYRFFRYAYASACSTTAISRSRTSRGSTQCSVVRRVRPQARLCALGTRRRPRGAKSLAAGFSERRRAGQSDDLARTVKARARPAPTRRQSGAFVNNGSLSAR